MITRQIYLGIMWVFAVFNVFVTNIINLLIMGIFALLYLLEFNKNKGVR